MFFIDQWEKLTDDQDVLQIVSGYCLEFDQEPMQTAPPTPFKLSRPEERLDQEIKKLLKKGSIEVVEHTENQFLSNIFTVPKKDGTRRPVIHLRQLNQFVKNVPFKMEDLTQLPSVLRKGDFLCKIGCLPVDPCCKESKSIPPFSLERETLSVHLPAFRTGVLTKNFYQMPEATAGLSSGSWGASAGLPGRFSYNGSYKGEMSGTGPANRRFIREARLSDKSREISVRTHSEAGILWVSNRHCGNEVFLARNENTQNSESGREISLRANFGKTTSQLSGPVAGYPSSYNNCAIVFSKSPERPFQGSKFLRRKSKLPDSGCAFLGVKRGVDVVEKLASFPQREKYSGSKRTGNNFLGCL